MECSKLGKTWIITDASSGMVRNTGFCDQNLRHLFIPELSALRHSGNDTYRLASATCLKRQTCLRWRLLRGELPHGFVIFIAVFFGSHTGKVLERLDKVALRRKGKVIGNVYDGLVRVAQEMRCLFYFFLADIVTDGNASRIIRYILPARRR